MGFFGSDYSIGSLLSRVQLDFSLNIPYSYLAQDASNRGFGERGTLVSLVNLGTGTTLFSDTSDDGSLYMTGTLNPGNYRLTVQASVSERSYLFGYSDANLNMDLSPLAPEPVPLPASAWLFGTGLVTLLARSRRRSSCQPE